MPNNNTIFNAELERIKQQGEVYSSKLSDLENDLANINSDSLKPNTDFLELVSIIDDLKMNIHSLGKTVSEPFKVAVMGTQGVGKSTVINLLLNENIMPHSYSENEAAIVKTIYTDKIELHHTANVCFFQDKNDVRVTEKLSSKEFLNLIDLDKSKDLIENPKYKDKVEYIEILSNNEKLKDVQVINTPGVNVLTSNFYEKVRHLFKEADIIIWVFSKNNMLNKFNTEKIKEIHKDNKNIIGILSKSDLLFGEDSEFGVKDAIEQFLTEIENQILYRVNRNNSELISLLPYNGNAAMIACGLKGISPLISDLDNIEAQEEKELMMLWNYIYLGYPYASSKEDFRFEFNLYTPQDHQPLSEKKTNLNFNCDDFLNELLVNNYVKKVKDNNNNYNIIYTEMGLELLMKCSQLSTIIDFSNNYIFSKKLKDKLNNVQERFDQLYTENNKLQTLSEIKSGCIEKLKKIDSDFYKKRKEFDDKLLILSDRFKEWYDNRLSVIIKQKGTTLINEITSRMENEISRVDMAKEIWSLMKKVFGGGEEGPAIKQIRLICEESIHNIVDASLDEIINNATQEIDNILKEIEHKLIDKVQTNIEYSSPNLKNKFKQPKPKIEISKIIEKLKPLLKKVLAEVAQKDLRKRMPQILKKMVKMLRSILKKVGVDFAKKQAAKSSKKIFGGPIAWIFLAYDLYDIPKTIYMILGDMKKQIKDDLEDNNSELTDSIRDIYSKIFNDILNETLTNLRSEFSIDDAIVNKIQTGIDISEQTLSIFNDYKNSLKTIE